MKEQTIIDKKTCCVWYAYTDRPHILGHTTCGVNIDSHFYVEKTGGFDPTTYYHYTQRCVFCSKPVVLQYVDINK